MISYSKILKDSYRITVSWPALWPFGLFVLGGMGLNLFWLPGFAGAGLLSLFPLQSLLIYLRDNPPVLALLALSFLLALAAAVLLANWSRIMLVLLVQSVLEKNRLDTAEKVKLSRKSLWPVIKVSIFTSLLLAVVALGLLGAPFWWMPSIPSQNLFWGMGAAIFLPLAATIASINIFTAFFIILYGVRAGKALNLGTDFFIANWSKVLGLGAVLTVIYSVCIIAGLAAVFLVNALAVQVAGWWGFMGQPAFLAAVSVLRFVALLFLWLLEAGLNVFFCTCLILLFFQLNTPTKDEAQGPEKIIVSPAAPA